MFAQPLTWTRRPALAHTSALATPAGWTVRIAPGIAQMVMTLAAETITDRFH
jgi:hypothetical protein